MNTIKDISPEYRAKWQVPTMETPLWLGKQHPYCVVIPVINEGERIKSLLKRMESNRIAAIADVIIVDAGSTDGSLELDALKQIGVRGLVVKKGPGKLSAQLRCAYAFALDQGYEGIVTIDGNDKDDPEAIPRFIEALEDGVDFVQASRFLPDGVAVNTPKLRDFAIRYIHAPCLSIASGFKWTDTTQGFRAYSRRMLLDQEVAVFRDEFSGYELLAYLSQRAPRLGYICRELPTTRKYPKGEVPTKISSVRGNFLVLNVLFKACFGFFSPRHNAEGCVSTNLNACIRPVGLWMFLFFLFLSTVHFYNGPGSNGNVEQWVNLTNQTLFGGQDFLFSYGPLYWITGGAATQYSETSYWVTVVFLSFVFSSFWAAGVWMASRANSVFLFAISFLFILSSPLMFRTALFLWPFVLIVYLDIYCSKNIKLRQCFFVGLLTAISFYFRFYWGLVALLTFGTYFLSRFIVEKNALKGLSFLTGVVLFYLIAGLIIFRDIDSLINYITINRELSFGNSIDMTLDVLNKSGVWVAVGILLLTLNIYALAFRRCFVLTINVLFITFLKLGFGRTDHYLDYFVAPVSVLGLLLLFDTRKVGRIAYLIIVICLCYLAFYPAYPGAKINNPFIPKIDFSTAYLDRMASIYNGFKLDADLLSIIGNKSIDIYPYNNEYAYANKLNYVHRPNFQSYMTLTPRLDSMNKVFFESDDRPEYILWTAGIVCKSLKCNPYNSFDGKYALNEDPLTTSSILLNYHLEKRSEGQNGIPIVLLKKNKEVMPYSEVRVGEMKKFEFGKWYKVPATDNGLIKIKPEFVFSLYGKIKNLIFRGGIVKIKYKFQSGVVKSYRLNLLNSSNGIVASPLIDNFDYTGMRPAEIMFDLNDSGYIEPVFNANWVVVPVGDVKARDLSTGKISNTQLSQYKVKSVSCEGNIDSFNGGNYSNKTFYVNGSLKMKGWLAFSAQDGELYDGVFLMVTDAQGKTRYIPAANAHREDVASAYRNDNLSFAGFELNLKLVVPSNGLKVGMAAVKGKTLFVCNQYHAQLKPE